MFDRKKIKFAPLSSRENKVSIDRDFIHPEDTPSPLPPGTLELIRQIAGEILNARKIGAPVILAFGAHTIKNGMTPVLRAMVNKNWITHLATNGAGIIHDWEFAFQGKSSEDVRQNVERGQFGLWEETGFYLNLAIAVGAYEGRGYGESVGAMVLNDGLTIPDASSLIAEINELSGGNPAQAAAAADLLSLIQDFEIKPGFMAVHHNHKEYGLQGEAFRLGIPFTGHPMFGHDIIYSHPVNCGAACENACRPFLVLDYHPRGVNSQQVEHAQIFAPVEIISQHFKGNDISGDLRTEVRDDVPGTVRLHTIDPEISCGEACFDRGLGE